MKTISKINTISLLLLISLALTAGVNFGKNQEQSKAQDKLLQSPFFGDFRRARKTEGKGEAALRVWDPYREYLQKFPPAGDDPALKGSDRLDAAYDEVWTSERDSFRHFGRKKSGKPYLVKLYWRDGEPQAFTVEKYFTQDPVTFRTLSEPGYRVILIHDRPFILQELAREAAKKKAFNALTPTAHLREAQKALAEGNPEPKDLRKRTYGRLSDARQHLEAIAKDEPGYGDARKLLKEVEAREKDQKKHREAVEQEARAEMLNRRERMVADLDRDFLAKGMDVKIELSGPDKTTVRMDSVLFSRPWVYLLVDQTDLLRDLKNAGFKEAVFTNKALKYSWDVDLEE
jgi:hypothetical protein